VAVRRGAALSVLWLDEADDAARREDDDRRSDGDRGDT
jgi:hypothetical protein